MDAENSVLLILYRSAGMFHGALRILERQMDTGIRTDLGPNFDTLLMQPPSVLDDDGPDDEIVLEFALRQICTSIPAFWTCESDHLSRNTDYRSLILVSILDACLRDQGLQLKDRVDELASINENERRGVDAVNAAAGTVTAASPWLLPVPPDIALNQVRAHYASICRQCIKPIHYSSFVTCFSYLWDL